VADRATESAAVVAPTPQERLRWQLSRFGPVIMLLAVVAGLSIAHPDFLTISNLMASRRPCAHYLPLGSCW
jgi:hypothetical protein